MANYTFLVADLSDQEVVDEVPFQTFRWSQPLDGSGRWSGTLPLRADRAGRGDSSTYRGVLDPNRSEVVVVRDGVPLWSGILTGVRKKGDTLTFDGPGLFSYFGSRLLRETRTYSGVDQLAIAEDVILWAQGQGALAYGATVGPAGGDIGLSVNTASSGVTRDRTYEGFQAKDVETTVRQLTQVRNGFDIGLSYSLSGSTLSRQVDFTYPSAGRDTPLAFDFPGVLEDYDWSEDGSRFANDVTIIGEGEGESMLIGRAQSAGSLATYPLWEARHGQKDLSVQSTLDDRAAAMLTAGLEPPRQIDARLRTGLGSWVVGDRVSVSIDDGYVLASGRHRIVSQSVEVDANGGEKITLSFLPSSLTTQ